MKDEKLMVILVSAIFTLALIGIDFFYSSWDILFSRDVIVGVIAVLMHLGCILLWLLVLAQINNPNYDNFRRLLIWGLVATIMVVGIHHATIREDKQVIIDSHENATK